LKLWKDVGAEEKNAILLSTSKKMQRYAIFFIIVNAVHVCFRWRNHPKHVHHWQ